MAKFFWILFLVVSGNSIVLTNFQKEKKNFFQFSINENKYFGYEKYIYIYMYVW